MIRIQLDCSILTLKAKLYINLPFLWKSINSNKNVDRTSFNNNSLYYTCYCFPYSPGNRTSQKLYKKSDNLLPRKKSGLLSFCPAGSLNDENCLDIISSLEGWSYQPQNIACWHSHAAIRWVLCNFSFNLFACCCNTIPDRLLVFNLAGLGTCV